MKLIRNCVVFFSLLGIFNLASAHETKVPKSTDIQIKNQYFLCMSDTTRVDLVEDKNSLAFRWIDAEGNLMKVLKEAHFSDEEIYLKHPIIKLEATFPKEDCFRDDREKRLNRCKAQGAIVTVTRHDGSEDVFDYSDQIFSFSSFLRADHVLSIGKELRLVVSISLTSTQGPNKNSRKILFDGIPIYGPGAAPCVGN